LIRRKSLELKHIKVFKLIVKGSIDFCYSHDVVEYLEVENLLVKENLGDREEKNKLCLPFGGK
jgi:hypothetical protein